MPPGSETITQLQRGDRILRINGDTVKSWSDVQDKLLASGSPARIAIAGRAEPLSVPLPKDQDTRRLAVGAVMPLMPARIGLVYPGEPAAKAGLQPGDVVVRANGDSIRSWNDLLFKLWYSPEKPVAVTVRRDTTLVHLTVTPKAQVDEDSDTVRPKRFGFIGAEGDFPEIKQRLAITTSVRLGAAQTLRQVSAVIGSVKRLVLGKASVKEVGGPILIAQVSGQAVRLGLDRFLMFIAFFSISLAVLNLLPIPVLDGGHAMFLIAEGIRRKPLSPQLRLRLTQLGMLLVLAIMVLAISNDVLRFFRWCDRRTARGRRYGYVLSGCGKRDAGYVTACH